jgi:O-antigen/teichoic acid export membrane protein
MLVGLWVTRLLLARLGAHDYGLWLVTLQILGYLALADVGVVALLPRETAYAAGRHDPGSDSELRQLTSRTIRLVLWQLPFVALAAATVWLWVPESWAGLRGPLAGVLIAFVALFPLRVLPALLQGMQNLAFVGLAQLAGWAVTTTISVGLVLAGRGLWALATGWIAGQILSAALCWTRLKLRYPAVLTGGVPGLSWSGAREYLAKSVWVSVAQVSQVLLAGSDVLIIGVVLGPAIVVPYVCTSKLVSVLANQPLISLHSALPGLSEMRVSESRERLLQATTALTQGTLILSGAVASVILPSNERFVEWWVGRQNFAGLALTAVLLANMIVRHGTSTIVFSLFAFGYEQQLAWLGLADGLASIVGTIALVHYFGFVGAPLASLSSACLVGLLMIRVYAQATSVPARRALVAIWSWCIWFVVAIAPGVAIALLSPPTTLIETAVGVGVSVLAYGLVQIPLLARAPLVLYMPRKAASLLARFSSAGHVPART